MEDPQGRFIDWLAFILLLSAGMQGLVDFQILRGIAALACLLWGILWLIEELKQKG